MARLSECAVQCASAVVRLEAEAEAEAGLGTNGARRKVQRLPADLAAVVWSIEIGLGRVNSELVDAALSAHGRRLVVFDSSEATGDLVGDMIEVLTSFCARLDGLRSARPGDQSARVPAQSRSSVGDPGEGV